MESEQEISMEKHLALKIESAVVAKLGPGVFTTTREHFFDHKLGLEMDHPSALLRQVIRSFLNLHVKTYGKKYSETYLHNNETSRHQLTKLILFRNM